MGNERFQPGSFVNAVRLGPSSSEAHAPSRRRVIEGWLTSTPMIGSPMVIWRSSGRQIMTSAVRRILGDADQMILHVQTGNSVYRVTVGSGAPSKPAGRGR